LNSGGTVLERFTPELNDFCFLVSKGGMFSKRR
jgi:hypothetical protein